MMIASTGTVEFMSSLRSQIWYESLTISSPIVQYFEERAGGGGGGDATGGCRVHLPGWDVVRVDQREPDVPAYGVDGEGGDQGDSDASGNETLLGDPVAGDEPDPRLEPGPQAGADQGVLGSRTAGDPLLVLEIRQAELALAGETVVRGQGDVHEVVADLAQVESVEVLHRRVAHHRHVRI